MKINMIEGVFSNNQYHWTGYQILDTEVNHKLGDLPEFARQDANCVNLITSEKGVKTKVYFLKEEKLTSLLSDFKLSIKSETKDKYLCDSKIDGFNPSYFIAFVKNDDGKNVNENEIKENQQKLLVPMNDDSDNDLVSIIIGGVTVIDYNKKHEIDITPFPDYYSQFNLHISGEGIVLAGEKYKKSGRYTRYQSGVIEAHYSTNEWELVLTNYKGWLASINRNYSYLFVLLNGELVHHETNPSELI
ncbi:hypothetical protein AB7Z61_20110 [Providencia rettgeri]